MPGCRLRCTACNRLQFTLPDVYVVLDCRNNTALGLNEAHHSTSGCPSLTSVGLSHVSAILPNIMIAHRQSRDRRRTSPA